MRVFLDWKETVSRGNFPAPRFKIFKPSPSQTNPNTAVQMSWKVKISGSAIFLYNVRVHFCNIKYTKKKLYDTTSTTWCIFDISNTPTKCFYDSTPNAWCIFVISNTPTKCFYDTTPNAWCIFVISNTPKKHFTTQMQGEYARFFIKM